MNEQHQPQDYERIQDEDILERSNFLKKLDNFWYHYKWTVIISTFFAVILVITIVQICKQPQYDVVVSMAAAYTPNSEQKEDMEALLSDILPEDFNGNGQKQVCFRSWQVYSNEEYAVEKATAEAESQRFDLNAKYNEDELSNFEKYMMNGECVICLVSPFVYERLKGGSRLEALSAIYEDDSLPVGAMEDGYGICLSETDLYVYNEAMNQTVPKTTVLCFMKPLVIGKNADEAEYRLAKQYFRALADYSLAE